MDAEEYIRLLKSFIDSLDLRVLEPIARVYCCSAGEDSRETLYVLFCSSCSCFKREGGNYPYCCQMHALGVMACGLLSSDSKTNPTLLSNLHAAAVSLYADLTTDSLHEEKCLYSI